MQAVNRIILDKAVSDVELIPKLAHHLIESGGKRLRPMLTIAAAKLCGYQRDGHVRLAAAVEFMHTATLLHDDVVDESDYRRGKASARRVWGNQASVLVGDFLLGQAFRMMVEVGSLSALKILSGAAAVIAEGEVMQLAAAKNTATTEDAYLAIIDAKTAALFSAAAEVGGAIANRRRGAGRAQSTAQSRHRLPAGRRRARYSGNSASSASRSATISARARSRCRDLVLPPRRRPRARLLEAHAERRQNRGRRLRARRRLMKKHNAIDATLERARHYGAIARDALAIFPPTPMPAL
jgi:octaprenyl-diphosphate synthase